jgi:hypothetical protein
VTGAGLWIASTLLATTALPTIPSSAASAGATNLPAIGAAAPEKPGIMAPPQQRGMTRVQAIARPFMGLTGSSFGAVSELRVEHYFKQPFMLGLEMAPLAIASTNQGTGAITHLRLHAAYVGDYFAIGFGAGARLRHFGSAGGYSLTPTLRLGTLDGLNLMIAYTHTIARNRYTGEPQLGFSNITSTLTVPLTRKLALQLDAGFSLDIWAYSTLGLRQRLGGDGGAGTWYLSGAFGFAWVSDRTICNFEATVPCTGGTALSNGPTISVGLERRF